MGTQWGIVRTCPVSPKALPARGQALAWHHWAGSLPSLEGASPAVDSGFEARGIEAGAQPWPQGATLPASRSPALSVPVGQQGHPEGVTAWSLPALDRAVTLASGVRDTGLPGSRGRRSQEGHAGLTGAVFAGLLGFQHQNLLCVALTLNPEIRRHRDSGSQASPSRLGFRGHQPDRVISKTPLHPAPAVG